MSAETTESGFENAALIFVHFIGMLLIACQKNTWSCYRILKPGNVLEHTNMNILIY